jgi:hypothetical protein
VWRAKKTAETTDDPDKPSAGPKVARRRRRLLAIGAVIVLLVVVGRSLAPQAVRWYVNRTLDQSTLYQGTVGDIDLHLWRGAYTIHDIKISKTIGNTPAPLFAARRVELALQWDALAEGKAVGQLRLHGPEINFVDSEDDSSDQSGAGEPWLAIIRDLFPFKINSAVVHDGKVRFRALDTDPPVDVYLSQVRGEVKNLTNIHDQTTPLVASVEARALAMDRARFEYQMKLDPFSYRPTFQLAVRLLGLDVTTINSLARAYGAFDFEGGWFDLVVEMDAKEGGVEGYVKPLFRNLQVVDLEKDARENAVQVFWEMLVDAGTELFKNPPRDQFGTRISFRGDLANPRMDLLEVVGNILHNAFVRAYLPRFRGTGEQINLLEFDPAEFP